MNIKNLLKFFTSLLSISFFAPLMLSSCSNSKSNSNSNDMFKQIKTINSLMFVYKYFIIPNQNDEIPSKDKILFSNFNNIIDKILGDDSGTLTTMIDKSIYSTLFFNSIFFWQINSLSNDELTPLIGFDYFVNRVNNIVNKYNDKSIMWNLFFDEYGIEWDDDIKNKISQNSFQEVGLKIVFPKCFGTSNKRTKLWEKLTTSEKETINIVNELLSNWYWISIKI